MARSRSARCKTSIAIALEEGASDGGEGDNLSHEVLVVHRAELRAAQGGAAPTRTLLRYESFEKTCPSVDRLLRPPQEPCWVHQCLPRRDCERKDCKREAPNWAMVIAGDYEPKSGKGKRNGAGPCCLEA